MRAEFFADGKLFAAPEFNDVRAKLPVAPPAGTQEVVIKLVIPVIDVQSYWDSTLLMSAPSNRIPWVIDVTSGAQKSFPFIAFFNQAGTNRAAISLTDLWDECRIEARMNQEVCSYDMTITLLWCAESKPFELIVDRREIYWADTLAAWRDDLEIPKQTYPDSVWEPVYCTWYACHAAVEEKWVEANAKIASEMGFGTLIIDDGWCFDTPKRVSPTTIVDWYEWIGDWEVSEKKLPDFKSHVKRVQDMGMRYLVWVAPFLIGKKSRLYNSGKVKTVGDYLEGYYQFDVVNDDATSKWFVDKLGKLVRDYNLDGLKVDFIDILAPNIKERKARKILAFVDALAKSIRANTHDAMIEFRQNYATMAMLPYGTQFRAGDAPFDYLLNFRRCIQIRLNIGTAGPVHADPAYWNANELPVNVSRHLIATLAGVPMLSVDMTKLSETEKAIIRHWIGFYREHLETFRSGKWDLRFNFNNVAYAAVETAKERIVIVNDAARVRQAVGSGGKPTHLLNLSADVLDVSGVKAWDWAGVPAPDGVVPLGGRGLVR